MRKMAAAMAVCAIALGIYVGFLHKPPRASRGQRETVLPGIEVEFSREGNAADFYFKACESLSRLASEGKMPNYLTPEERRWFMLGTSCRRSSFYPEHYPHPTEEVPMPQLVFQEHLARLMIREGRSAEETGREADALDIWKRVAVFGWHLETEEEGMIQVLTGIRIEFMAYDELARYHREHGDADEASRYEGFVQARRDELADWRKVSRLESEADYQRIKQIALSHKSALYRKQACFDMDREWVAAHPSLFDDIISWLTEVSRQDPDPLVREVARNRIAYLLRHRNP